MMHVTCLFGKRLFVRRELRKGAMTGDATKIIFRIRQITIKSSNNKIVKKWLRNATRP